MVSLALQPNSAPSTTSLLSNFYYCFHWSVVPSQVYQSQSMLERRGSARPSGLITFSWYCIELECLAVRLFDSWNVWHPQAQSHLHLFLLKKDGRYLVFVVIMLAMFIMVIIVAIIIMFLSPWSSGSSGQTRQTRLTFKLDFFSETYLCRAAIPILAIYFDSFHTIILVLVKCHWRL